MIQNLKLDIIYHQSPSDFEMEFNLCGCCRMRLLSDKTTDKKTFVKALARDVSRSRVIIACGPLFGDEGLVNLVAKAIGNGVSLCNNKTFGINTNDDIYIIDGSTPLVTSDGYFGGCIIESGPQTIILLTENKAFRKTIMQNLIHPYIEEISYIPSVQTAIITPSQPDAENEMPQTAVTEDENYITEAEEDYDSAVEDASYMVADGQQDEHNISFVMDGESHEEEEETVIEVASAYDNMYTEIEHPDEIKARYEHPYTTSESDNMFIFDSDSEEDLTHLQKEKDRAVNIAIVIMVLVLALALLSLLYLLVLRPVTMGADIKDYIKEIFGTVSGNSLV